MSVKFSDGPRGAKGFGTVLVTPSAKRAIPIFTIPGSGSSGGALRLTSWLQKKLRQRQSELMQDSKVVIIYYPSTMEEEALKTAEEYISQGIYAMPLRLQDETIYRYEEDGSTGFVTAESKKLTKARKKSLTIAYLPTADIRVPEWRSDDPNDRISQNNALASRLVDRALGHSSAETIYSHYLYAFGLCDKKIEGFDFEEG